ncbi:hypothetical protein [Vibrio ouci]|uniref:Uncharacterized protein n=1 Tax=Vibrio ouci TaxID=2499078 RepID=A0A4Y8WA78_9VIBR|nr:hypothetical protein [Vibrio ouci]TFH89191.1 hypothetical protein ELS82_23580 [Vibrio ouci]
MKTYNLHAVTFANDSYYTVILPSDFPNLTENKMRSWAKCKSETSKQRIAILDCDAKFKHYTCVNNGLTELQAHEMRVELLHRVEAEGKRTIINNLKRCETSLEKHRNAFWDELEEKGIKEILSEI